MEALSPDPPDMDFANSMNPQILCCQAQIAQVFDGSGRPRVRGDLDLEAPGRRRLLPPLLSALNGPPARKVLRRFPSPLPAVRAHSSIAASSMPSAIQSLMLTDRPRDSWTASRSSSAVRTFLSPTRRFRIMSTCASSQ